MKPILQLIILTIVLSLTSVANAKKYDLVIKNGLVIDGSRNVGTKVNVAIDDGKIVYVGTRKDIVATKIIDATGLVVSPGFIDVHNHAEYVIQIEASLENESYIRQGVTTVVAGPDGALSPKNIIKLQQYIKTKGSSTNVAVYVGQNGIRKEVMGMEPVLSNPKQISSMKTLVKEGMELGAVGFSTGLMYEPGMYSNTEEVIELAKVAASFGGSYDSHVRNPVHQLIDSYKEAIEIGRQANLPVKLAHVKLVGFKNRDLFPQVEKLINDARNEGLSVVSDQYPYDGAANDWLWKIIALPKEMMPEKETELTRDWVVALLSDGDKSAKLKQFNENGKDNFSWVKAVGYGSMRVVVAEAQPELVGKHISELADELGKNGFDVIADMITNPKLNINITLGSVLEENVRNFLRKPWNMVSSDGVWTDTTGALISHPRSTGSFPRILGRYVRQEGLLDLSEAIYKMSAFHADFLGLGKRGYIREGYIADIAIFDPEKISDRSDWVHPERMSVGMNHVIINGKLAMENGEITQQLAGQFVKHDRIRSEK